MNKKDNELYHLLESLDGLNQDIEEELPYIGVTAFKEMFKDIGDSKKRPYIINKWIELAGTSTGNVKIVDNDGNLLFIMPGIISADLKPSSPLVSSIDDLASTADELNANFKGSGDAMFLKTMKDIVLSGSSNTDVWNKVLEEMVPLDTINEEKDAIEETDDFDYFE